MVLSSIGKIFSKKSSPSNSADDVNTIDLATQRQLIWRRFKRHRLGFSASIVVILFYVVFAILLWYGFYQWNEQLAMAAV